MTFFCESTLFRRSDVYQSQSHCSSLVRTLKEIQWLKIVQKQNNKSIAWHIFEEDIYWNKVKIPKILKPFQSLMVGFGKCSKKKENIFDFLRTRTITKARQTSLTCSSIFIFVMKALHARVIAWMNNALNDLEWAVEIALLRDKVTLLVILLILK